MFWKGLLVVIGKCMFGREGCEACVLEKSSVSVCVRVAMCACVCARVCVCVCVCVLGRARARVCVREGEVGEKVTIFTPPGKIAHVAKRSWPLPSLCV